MPTRAIARPSLRSRSAATALRRIALAASLAALAITPSEAANTGNRTGAVVTAGGWTNFTTARLNSSNDLRATNATNNDFGVLGTFSFGVPPGSVVTGITALVEGNASAGTVDYALQLSWDGGSSWTTAKADSFTSATDAIDTLGGTSDTWGRAWTVAELANGVFQLRIYKTSGATLAIDHVQVAVEYTPNPYLMQGHYRWRLDDGPEATATWAAPEDTKLPAVPRMSLRRLRFEVSNEGGASSGSVEYRLQASRSETCSSASYQDVPVDYLGPAWDWEVSDSFNFADQAVTTNVASGVTDEATTFVAGMMKDAGNYTLGGITLAGDQFTEIEFAVRATASAATGANYCFRLFDRTNNRVLDTYSSYAQASVASGGGTLVRTGSYVGNGTTPRPISVGFRPDVVIVKGNLDEYAVIRTATMTTSRSIFYDNFNPWSDAIRSLDAGGFTVGADVKVNSSGITYYWTAFQAGAGEMAIGTYDGNSVDNRNITGLGFQPEYVLVMDQGAHWSNHRFAAQVGDLSMTVEGGVLGPNKIQALLADGFQVGTDTEVNDATPLTRYHWVAFNHVPGRVHISSYTGNGGTQSITAPGFPPEYVLVSRDQNSPMHQKPASIGATSNLSHPWGGYPAATNVSNAIRTVLASGFEVGTDPDANALGVSYYYAAFAAARLEQVHTRWRNDDGSEVAATWAAAEDTAITALGVGSKRRVRFAVSNEGAVASDATAYELQVAGTATCATGVYTTVTTAASGPFQLTDSTFLTDAAATTNVAGGLTDEGATFVPGQVKDAGSATGTITLATGQFTEIEFSLQATANVTPGGTYCFRLYDATAARPLDGYWAYAQASLPTLTLANLTPTGQVGDQFSVTTPVTATLFQFRLSRSGTVTVDTLRVRFSTGSGVASGDVSAGELWEDTNGNGTFDGAGPDTLLQGAVAPAGGVLTFSANFSPAVAGTNYFVRATVANLAGGDSTTFSLAAADIDPVEAGVGETGAITNAVHSQDFSTGGDVYYSIGTSALNLMTGTPTITISNGTATLSVAQTGYIGVGDEITYNGGADRAFIRSVVSPSVFAVHTPTGGQPGNVSGQPVNSIRRAFNSIAAAVSGSSGASYLTSANLAGLNRRLTWVCYNDGPFNVTTGTSIQGYNTDATRYITLTVAGAADTVLGASHRHDGTAGSGAVLRAQQDAFLLGTILRVNQAYTRVEWLEIDGASYAGHDGIYVDTGGNDALLRNLVVHDVGRNGALCPNPPSAQTCRAIAGPANNLVIRNSFIYDFGQDGIDVSGTGVYVANTSVFRTKATGNPGESIQSAGSILIENVITADASIYSGGTPFVCNNTFSSDGSAADGAFGCTGTANRINVPASNSFVSTVAGNVDLHLKYTADAVGAGKNLSGSFTDDIDGETRSAPWDIGADEFGSASGVMVVKSGSYTGDGADNRAIYVGFQPDLVIVKRDSGTGADDYHGVARTSTMAGDTTKDLDFGGAATFANGIQALTATGFVLGTDARVNSSLTYHWIAFKAGAGEMVVGSYTGTGADNRSVTGVGFRPDYVMVLPAGAQRALSRTSSMPGDESYDWDANQYTDRIQALEPDGFQLGTSTDVNQNLATYHYVAWNATPGKVAVGSYTGNGALLSGTTQQITSVGFMPEWVLVKRAGAARPWVHKPASTGAGTNYSLFLSDWAGFNNDIQFLQAQGFQVIAQDEGATDRVNETGVTYHYAAFGPHAGGTNYRSIGTALDYATGTVEAINGSPTIAGTGTAWAAANRGRGDVIVIPCPNPPTCTGGTAYQVLAVGTNTQLTLSSAFTGTSAAGLSYVIRRQHATLLSWYQCISNQAACPYFDAPTASLVADDRREVGIAYDESAFSLGATLNMNVATTDPTHDIVLTADAGNRHAGTAGTGVVVNPPAGAAAFFVRDNDVTIEWLDIAGGGRGVDIMTPFSGTGRLVLRNNVIRNTTQDAVRFTGAQDALIANNFIYLSAADGIDLGGFSSKARIYNNTIYGVSLTGITGCTNPDAILRNNIVVANAGGDIGCTARDPASSHNLTVNGSGPANSPAGGGVGGVSVTTNPTTCGSPPCVGFVSITGGSENLHLLSTTYANSAVDAGASLSSVFVNDIDNQLRSGTWDIGADERDATTEVKLASFRARPLAAAVRVEWETASELDNLGFHLYRGLSASGPWTRLTTSLIAGLGSSAVGRAYSWLDTGLSNGVRYFYRLEDVDTRSKVTSHGPVSAVPDARLADPTEGRREPEGDDPSTDAGAGKGSTSACPAWVAAAYGQTAPTGSEAPLRCTRHGNPEAVSLEVQPNGPSGALVELRTEGFYAVHEAGGSVRVFVAGFDTPDDPAAPALPLRRTLVDALVGRRVELVAAEARDLVAFRGLRPAAVGVPEVEVSRQGAVRGARRAVRPARLSRDYVPKDVARLAGTVFQGEAKSAVVELAPLRYDGGSGQLVLARRVRARLSFAGRDLGESGRGSRGRKPPRPDAPSFAVLAHLHTTERGLHAVRFEQLFAAGAPALPLDELQLRLEGAPVGFHVEPASARFGPGSVLYFHASRVAASTDFTGEVAWQLVRATGGVPLAAASAAPAGAAALAPTGRAELETNRLYVPGLVDAPDVWLWDACLTGRTIATSFALPGLDATSTRGAELIVHLQGGSESGQAVDHHLVISIGGVPLGEVRFAGKRPYAATLPVPAGLLQETANELQLTSVADTGVSSVVYLDRVTLDFPQRPALRQGRFEGRWAESGAATIEGVTGPTALLDVTEEPARWLAGFELAGGALRFQAEAGRRYLAADAAGLRVPRVQAVPASTLAETSQQADYLLVAPAGFLDAARPLIERRQAQGLTVRAVAFEEIAQVFGHGRPSAEAVRAFLAFAYHSWSRPSPRYVLLVGDASYDPRNFTGFARPAPLPALFVKTAFLSTVSDPALAAVNGEDALPDLAIGRLPAGSAEEAARLVDKLLAWEDSGQALSGEAVIVADNPDAGGDFEANARDIAESFLWDRSARVLKLGQLGAGSRNAIRDAFDAGASLMSYVGHGGSAVWATENVWNSWDAASLREQSRQPLLMTWNCLNGYFVPPTFDSLAESLVKVDGRGAVAAFAPSGLSLDGPAHEYHRALVAELASGAHERLGDAIAAAQSAYARTGVMPELLGLYHLFGDPAMKIR